MQQLRPRVRARQTTAALGEESALRGYPCWAVTEMVGRNSFSSGGTQGFRRIRAFYGSADESSIYGASSEQELATLDQTFETIMMWMYDSFWGVYRGLQPASR